MYIKAACADMLCNHYFRPAIPGCFWSTKSPIMTVNTNKATSTLIFVKPVAVLIVIAIVLVVIVIVTRVVVELLMVLKYAI